MRKILMTVGLLLLASASSGCGLLRGIEQWKCDNLGICQFGIQPSRPGPVYYGR